jgi:hypothetical protein
VNGLAKRRGIPLRAASRATLTEIGNDRGAPIDLVTALVQGWGITGKADETPIQFRSAGRRALEG